MNKINRKVEYALIALQHMSAKRPGELTSAKEVAESYSVPFDVLARVLQTLSSNQILESTHGPQGGYVIVKDLSRLSMHQLMEILLGPVGIAKCLHSHDCELASACNIISPVHFLNRRLLEFYKALSVREVLDCQESDDLPRRDERSHEIASSKKEFA